jgi:hypothetical protein
MLAFCPSLLRPLPAKNCAPPCEICIITGDLASRAASRTALIDDDDVTFIAGIAN